jgi:NTE family protein
VSKLDRIFKSVSAFKRELTRGSDAPRKQAQPLTRPRIGVALGGGFARGLAHIGVLKVLHEENIPVDYIGGTSMGAAIGSAYASGVSAKELEEICALLKFSDFARWTISRLGLYSNDRMTQLLKRVLKVHTFEELQIPLAVCATEFLTGESAIFTKGNLVDAVRASCAYPGVFHPVRVDGKLMVDGLLAHPVPATPVKQMGADKVIAVYFNSHWVGENGPKHVMDIIGQCFSIAQANVCSLWQVNADLVIEPNVGSFAYDAFNKAPDPTDQGLVRPGNAAGNQSRKGKGPSASAHTRDSAYRILIDPAFRAQIN